MRLTIRNSDGTVSQPMNLDWSAALEKLAAYEDMELTPEEFHESVAFVLELNKKLKPYMDAEENGLLVRLPCKVGDTVFAAFEDEDVFCGKVYAISTCDGTNWFSVRYDSGLRYDHRWDAIGKTVFLSREEAEATLKGE